MRPFFHLALSIVQVAAACDRVSKSNAELETRLATAANMELTASAGIDKEQGAFVSVVPREMGVAAQHITTQQKVVLQAVRYLPN